MLPGTFLFSWNKQYRNNMLRQLCTLFFVCTKCLEEVVLNKHLTTRSVQKAFVSYYFPALKNILLNFSLFFLRYIQIASFTKPGIGKTNFLGYKDPQVFLSAVVRGVCEDKHALVRGVFPCLLVSGGNVMLRMFRFPIVFTQFKLSVRSKDLRHVSLLMGSKGMEKNGGRETSKKGKISI